MAISLIPSLHSLILIIVGEKTLSYHPSNTISRWQIHRIPHCAEKWVVNISKHKLTQPQETVLAKGLNFSPSPDQVPYEEYIVATEQACKKLPYNEAAILRSEIAGVLRSARPPKANITKEERRAVQELKKDDSILILPADKGKATVLMDVSEYEEKIHNMLSD